MQEDNKGDLQPVQRDFGVQPLAQVMQANKLTPHNLVEASKEQLNHKMVSRAVKGRRLTRNVKVKILNALNAAAMSDYKLQDIFNYR